MWRGRGGREYKQLSGGVCFVLKRTGKVRVVERAVKFILSSFPNFLKMVVIIACLCTDGNAPGDVKKIDNVGQSRNNYRSQVLA